MSERAVPWATPCRLVEMLRHEGFAASIEEDEPDVVEFDVAGFICYVLPYPPADLQLAVGFERGKQPFDIQVINGLNRHVRFAKLVLDEDGDLLVLMDLSLAWIEGEKVGAFFGDCVRTWEELVVEVVGKVNLSLGDE